MQKSERTSLCKEYYISNPATFSCKNVNHVESAIADSVIISDEIRDTTKAVPIKGISTKTVLKNSNSTNFHILLITMALFVAVSVCLIKNETKKTFIANIKNHTCYYFYGIIKIEDFDKILIDEKSCKHILVYNISFKILIGAKPMRIRLDKRNEFIRVHDGTRYLVLFTPKKYHAIYNRIRCLISQKSGITCALSYSYVKIKVIYTILFAFWENIYFS